jgi:hypothetical protein
LSNDTTRLFDLVEVEVVGLEVGADDIPMLALVTLKDRRTLMGRCIKNSYKFAMLQA